MIDDWFAPEGPLARNIPGFASRRAQVEMARAVEDALSGGGLQIIEAGTGTGKTFAYLVPALVAERRVIVSTGTKNLQDQLFERDLPRLLNALRVPARTAMLKGRSNYLCVYRLQRAGQDAAASGRRLPDPRLRQIEQWARRTERGEIAELGQMVEDERLRFQITSTADNCLGAKCPEFGNCFVVRSRRNAMGADLVVVNHHVLLSDVLLKEEGFGEILPQADAVIVDEAHQLPDLAGQFFGTRVSSRQLRDLGDDVLAAAAEAGDLPELGAAVQGLAAPLIAWESALMALRGRRTLAAFAREADGMALFEALDAALAGLLEMLAGCRDRHAALDALYGRAQCLQARLRLCHEQDDPSQVRWVEPLGRGGVVHATPLDLGAGFARVFAAQDGAWVLTSATLSAAGNFDHFRRQIGRPDAAAIALDSPFDYARQARLLIPRDLPDPSASDYSERVADLAQTLIRAGDGGAFVLCTSHRALRVIAERLRSAFGPRLYVQGEDDRARLVEQFAARGDAVLVGTHSFWEGVDVKGRALRLVIIDKLPFTAPGDPVYDARLEALREQGRAPFTEIQLPEAIVSLRQGAGRLIRDEHDRGLLVLCDPRLQTKGYGRQVLGALPMMPRVDEAAALAWLRIL